jgi:hypothetical protein
MKQPAEHQPNLITAHNHCSRHRSELEASQSCGCFYCLTIFPSKAIEHWLNEGDGTALCPECGIDSVIGSASGFAITLEFLAQMHAFWF